MCEIALWAVIAKKNYCFSGNSQMRVSEGVIQAQHRDIVKEWFENFCVISSAEGSVHSLTSFYSKDCVQVLCIFLKKEFHSFPPLPLLVCHGTFVGLRLLFSVEV